jgi:nitrate/nitrite transport system permease protein
MRRALAAAGWGLVGFAVVVLAWEVLGPDRLPGPGDVFARLRADIADPFYDAGPNDKGIAILLWASLQRVASGFLIAVAVGVPLGLLMGTSRRWWQAVNPVVQLFRPVSPLAWFPVWATWFMDSDRASTWVIFLTALWPIILNTASGAADIPDDQRNVARVFRFKRSAYLRHVLIPNALPSIVVGLRVAAALGKHQEARAHMRDVEKAGVLAGPFVFGHDAARILHRQLITAERHHAAAQGDVLRVQRREFEVFGVRFAHQLFPGCEGRH